MPASLRDGTRVRKSEERVHSHDPLHQRPLPQAVQASRPLDHPALTPIPPRHHPDHRHPRHPRHAHHHNHQNLVLQTPQPAGHPRTPTHQLAQRSLGICSNLCLLCVLATAGQVPPSCELLPGPSGRAGRGCGPGLHGGGNTCHCAFDAGRGNRKCCVFRGSRQDLLWSGHHRPLGQTSLGLRRNRARTSQNFHIIPNPIKSPIDPITPHSHHKPLGGQWSVVAVASKKADIKNRRFGSGTVPDENLLGLNHHLDFTPANPVPIPADDLSSPHADPPAGLAAPQTARAGVPWVGVVEPQRSQSFPGCPLHHQTGSVPLGLPAVRSGTGETVAAVGPVHGCLPAHIFSGPGPGVHVQDQDHQDQGGQDWTARKHSPQLREDHHRCYLPGGGGQCGMVDLTAERPLQHLLGAPQPASTSTMPCPGADVVRAHFPRPVFAGVEQEEAELPPRQEESLWGRSGEDSRTAWHQVTSTSTSADVYFLTIFVVYLV